MPAKLDTKKAHLVRYHGDLAVLFTWIDDARSMVLVPHLRPGAPWWILKEPDAWAWDDSDPDNLGDIARRLVKAADVLGMEPNTRNCQRLARIIIDGIPDLTRMPSAPPPEYHRGSFGRMLLNADGKPLASEDIRLEKEGVTYG